MCSTTLYIVVLAAFFLSLVSAKPPHPFSHIEYNEISNNFWYPKFYSLHKQILVNDYPRTALNLSDVVLQLKDDEQCLLFDLRIQTFIMSYLENIPNIQSSPKIKSIDLTIMSIIVRRT